MAFEIKDFFRSYVTMGDLKGLFNVARMDRTSAVEIYYAYLNEVGSYIIQQVTTAGTTAIKVYKYYAKKKGASTFDTDWTGRTSLTYKEYYELFRQT